MSLHLSRRARLLGSCQRRGLSLVFALLALAAMMLAAIALVRSVDSGTLVLGNLAFKQDTAVAADRAAEAAITWLKNSTAASLTLDNEPQGYYATSQDALDPTGQITSAANRLAVVDWGDSDSCACVAAGTCASCSRKPSNPVLGLGSISARYIITRLCPATGAADATNNCAQILTNSSGVVKEQGAKDYANPNDIKGTAHTPYYRIVVRAVGPRNTVSFTETIVR